ncbi:MAG: cobalamin B12-binding domain-containing protein [Pirellulales bacterium]
MPHDQQVPRVVLAKLGLDGHDRGIRIIARGLRDAGFHVIYAGLWQTPAAVVQAVLDEDANWLGISLLSGAHMTLVPQVLAELKQQGAADCRVIVGGIIPSEDVAPLKAQGVAAVFGPATPIAEIVQFMRDQTP